jgi:hypothetical protein
LERRAESALATWCVLRSRTVLGCDLENQQALQPLQLAHGCQLHVAELQYCQLSDPQH